MDFDWNTVFVLLGALGGFGVLYAIFKFAFSLFFKKQQLKGVQDFQQTTNEYSVIVKEFIESDKNEVDINTFVEKLLAKIKFGKINTDYLEKKLKKE